MSCEGLQLLSEEKSVDHLLSLLPSLSVGAECPCSGSGPAAPLRFRRVYKVISPPAGRRRHGWIVRQNWIRITWELWQKDLERKSDSNSKCVNIVCVENICAKLFIHGGRSAASDRSHGIGGWAEVVLGPALQAGPEQTSQTHPLSFVYTTFSLKLKLFFLSQSTFSDLLISWVYQFLFCL